MAGYLESKGSRNIHQSSSAEEHRVVLESSRKVRPLEKWGWEGIRS